MRIVFSLLLTLALVGTPVWGSSVVRAEENAAGTVESVEATPGPEADSIAEVEAAVEAAATPASPLPAPAAPPQRKSPASAPPEESAASATPTADAPATPTVEAEPEEASAEPPTTAPPAQPEPTAIPDPTAPVADEPGAGSASEPIPAATPDQPPTAAATEEPTPPAEASTTPTPVTPEGAPVTPEPAPNPASETEATPAAPETSEMDAPAGALIQGYVFLDVDSDGIPAPSEPPVSGVTVHLHDASGGSWPAVTHVDGTFAFADVPPGTFSLTLAAGGRFAFAAYTSAVPTVPVQEGVGVIAVELGILPLDEAGRTFVPADAAAGGAVEAATFGPVVDWRAFVPTNQPAHLAAIKQAADESTCGIPWQVLAAIARVESNFGQNMATSSAGAIGYGQFLPSSWAAWGREGNPYDYRDALPAMAAYLCDHNAENDLRQAIWHYNHADWYVNLILAVAASYDELAPNAPLAAIVEMDLATTADRPLRYAPGRDTRAQSKRKELPDGTLWLGVPFRTLASLQDGWVPSARRALTALSMVLAAFPAQGSSTDTLPRALARALEQPGSPTFDSLAAVARETGLASVDLRSDDGAYQAWTVEMARWHLQQGRPVLALVDFMRLPGHGRASEGDDHYIVLTGTTPDGFIYNDPAFATTLGYGLALRNDELAWAWQAATTPFRGAAFGRQGDPTVQPYASEAQAAAPAPTEPVPSTERILEFTTPAEAQPLAVRAPSLAADVQTSTRPEAEEAGAVDLAQLEPAPDPDARVSPDGDTPGVVFEQTGQRRPNALVPLLLLGGLLALGALTALWSSGRSLARRTRPAASRVVLGLRQALAALAALRTG